MNRLALAGVLALALVQLHPAPARAQTTTALSGATCPSSNVVNVGNNRPQFETQQGYTCVTGTLTTTPSGTQDVNLKQIGGATVAQGHGTAAAALRVELPTDGTGVVGLNAGSAIVGKVGIDQTTPGTTNLVAVSSLPLPTGASTSALQSAVQTPITPATATATAAVLQGAQYNSSLPTYTNTQQGSLQITSRGTALQTLATSDGSSTVATATPADNLANAGAGIKVNSFTYGFDGTAWDRIMSSQGAVSASGSGNLSVEEAGRSFCHIATNTTTTCKSGAGFLHTISINTKGLTNTVTVYDNTAGSGTVIAIIDTTLGQDTLTYDAAFATGLTAVTAGGTPADITATYR